MSLVSETILPTSTHVNDSTPQVLVGNKFQGDGYYGRSDGLHTIQISLNEFVGRIEMQGTLAVNPSDEDWFAISLGTGTMSVDTTGALREENITFINYEQETTNCKTYNFVGNYVWVRARISNWSSGTIISIKLNR